MMLRPAALAASLCALVAVVQALKLTTDADETPHPDLTTLEDPFDSDEDTNLVASALAAADDYVTEDAVRVPFWYGRLGNNLIQVAKALMKAEILGKSRVELPKPMGQGTFSVMFSAPMDRISVTPDKEMSSRVQCVSQQKPLSALSFKACSNYTVTDISRLLSQYVRPLMKKEGETACKAEAASVPEHELVIHLRSGDLRMNTNHIQGIFAPCDFFDMIIEQHGFKSVKVVTEPDRKHVCLNTLQERNPTVNVTVQSKSVAEDACVLLTAKHVAYGSMSTFSLMLATMNKNLQAVYSPLRQDLFERQGDTRYCETKSPMGSFTAACPPKAAKFYEYCIPDWDEQKTAPGKTQWMLSDHRSKIRLDRCEDVAVWRG